MQDFYITIFAFTNGDSGMHQPPTFAYMGQLVGHVVILYLKVFCDLTLLLTAQDSIQASIRKLAGHDAYLWGFQPAQRSAPACIGR